MFSAVDVSVVLDDEPCEPTDSPKCETMLILLGVGLRGDERNFNVIFVLSEFFPNNQDLRDTIGFSDAVDTFIVRGIRSTSPTMPPTRNPTEKPSIVPSGSPTMVESSNPTFMPVATPVTMEPTKAPIVGATPPPTSTPPPTPNPTKAPTKAPTKTPTASPTFFPTPTPPPTLPEATPNPTQSPSRSPTGFPTSGPTPFPTRVPSSSPSFIPTQGPTELPSSVPSRLSSSRPTENGAKYGYPLPIRLNGDDTGSSGPRRNFKRWIMPSPTITWLPSVTWEPETRDIPITAPESEFKYIIRSTVDPVDPKAGDCIRYGDEILIQSDADASQYLSGGRNSDNREAWFHDYTDSYYETSNNVLRGVSTHFWWRIRSEAGNGQWDDSDPSNACVDFGDPFYLQVASANSRWLNGGRTVSNKQMYTSNMFGDSESVRFVYKWIFQEVPEEFLLTASSAVASQSSTYQSGSASLAIDGGEWSEWSSESVSHTDFGDTSPWWRVDFNLPQLNLIVTRVEVYNRIDVYQIYLDRIVGSTVALLDANENILQSEVITTAETFYIFEYASGIAGVKAIRISKSTEILHLAEVEAIGYSA